LYSLAHSKYFRAPKFEFRNVTFLNYFKCPQGHPY
jgi:hypothetical protein